MLKSAKKKEGPLKNYAPLKRNPTSPQNLLLKKDQSLNTT